MGRKTVAISMEELLQYLLITVTVVPLEKVSFSDTQNPKAIFQLLTVDEKHYLLTRDNLTKAIQIQLFEKQKTFPQFFLHF